MGLKFFAICLVAASIFKSAFFAESEDSITQGADARLLAAKYMVYNLGAVETAAVSRAPSLV